VHTHPDLCMLLPETLSLELGWPIDEGAQKDIDNKKRKASKEIKVDAARDMVSFTQFTRSRGTTKVVVVFPAERMNHVTANTLLKTLEEPPGAVKFILATDAAHQLLPTIRSRCITHTLVWPEFDEALQWLNAEAGQGEGNAGGEEGEGGKGSARSRAAKPPALADLQTLLTAAGGRPADALAWARAIPAHEAAGAWQALPAAMARGDVGALTGWPPAGAIVTLQKLCHDLLAVRSGAEPRFFSAAAIGETAAGAAGLAALTAWSKELAQSARTAEHPYNPGLMIEHLVSRARLALSAK
jgi:DNA polymerase III subunit delta'